MKSVSSDIFREFLTIGASSIAQVYPEMASRARLLKCCMHYRHLMAPVYEG